MTLHEFLRTTCRVVLVTFSSFCLQPLTVGAQAQRLVSASHESNRPSIANGSRVSASRFLEDIRAHVVAANAARKDTGTKAVEIRALLASRVNLEVLEQQWDS